MIRAETLLFSTHPFIPSSFYWCPFIASAMELKWPKPPKRAPPVPTSDWEKHKDTIYDLWKDATLKELMDVMRVDHNFEPSAKQYVLQLKKWGMYKYATADQPLASNKRPHPSQCTDPRVMPDTPQAQMGRGAKKSRTSATEPMLSVDGFEFSLPDREKSDTGHESTKAPPWMCFCGSHATNFVRLSEPLLKVSIITMAVNHPLSHIQQQNIIERAENAADFFLHVRCEREAFQLYALFLKWTLDHKGPFCSCVRSLAHRARIGCALSAIVESDLEAANVLLDQTKSLSPPGESTESWLLYESIFTWRLYSSCGVLKPHGEEDAIRRLETRFRTVDFCRDTTPYKTLGIMTCYEILSVIKESDAKLHIVNLELGERHGNACSTASESHQEIYPSDLFACLRWMLGLQASRSSNQVSLLPRRFCVSGCTRVGSSDFLDCFCLYWIYLQNEVSPPSWFQKPESIGIRPTELLAVIVHLVIEEGLPLRLSIVGSNEFAIRNLLVLDESQLLGRFNDRRFNRRVESSLSQLSGHVCTRDVEFTSPEIAMTKKHLRITLEPLASPTNPAYTLDIPSPGSADMASAENLDSGSPHQALAYTSASRSPEHRFISELPGHLTAPCVASSSSPGLTEGG
ncbi:hypothetical protein QBC39DRAFT_81379 [Podospora conica]|nr:hypothetical protein QBC39DRAFT_81379 [Schizothecium conicum]